MKLRGRKFGSVFVASGALNFFGQGYWFHKYLKFLTLGMSSFSGATFIAKTTPYDYNPGNLEFGNRLQPKELIPKSIWVNPVKEVVLNSVGLSSPGAKVLFNQNIWQNLKKPFGLSFAVIKEDRKERLNEARRYRLLLKRELPKFRAPIFLQINVSCPNTKCSLQGFTKETLELLEIFSDLDIPLDLKLNLTADIELIQEVQDCGFCDVITCSNTIPFGSFPGQINWRKLFSQGSPLKDLGGGGLSGLPVFPLVMEWALRMRNSGITMPLKLSNGIIYPFQVDMVKKVGGNAIEIGSVELLRPYNTQRIIKRAQYCFD